MWSGSVQRCRSGEDVNICLCPHRLLASKHWEMQNWAWISEGHVQKDPKFWSWTGCCTWSFIQPVPTYRKQTKRVAEVCKWLYFRRVVKRCKVAGIRYNREEVNTRAMQDWTSVEWVKYFDTWIYMAKTVPSQVQILELLLILLIWQWRNHLMHPSQCICSGHHHGGTGTSVSVYLTIELNFFLFLDVFWVSARAVDHSQREAWEWSPYSKG